MDITTVLNNYQTLISLTLMLDVQKRKYKMWLSLNENNNECQEHVETFKYSNLKQKRQ